MKRTILFLLCFILHFKGYGQTDNAISAKDLKKIVGCWQGSLTYLDYTSNKPFTMTANLNITRIGRSNEFVLANIYPKEPQANSFDTLIVSTDGRKINTETIISKRKTEDGSLEIITELDGTDGNDNKPATFRFTYTVGKKVYTYKKEVRFAGQQGWIKRHEYIYSSILCK